MVNKHLELLGLCLVFKVYYFSGTILHILLLGPFIFKFVFASYTSVSLMFCHSYLPVRLFICEVVLRSRFATDRLFRVKQRE